MASSMDSSKTTPKDALVMASILKEMGVSEYEPRVINQMLEFSYRYITDTLEDARVCSLHASKKQIDVDDVKLAVERKLDHSFTSPPPREFLLEVARKKNGQPLPLIQEKSGLRLPPDRYCLTGCNYRLKSGTGATKKGSSTQQRVNVVNPKGFVPGQNIGTSKIGSTVPREAMLGNQRHSNISLTPQNVIKSVPKAMLGEKQDVAIKLEKAPKSSTVTSLPSMEETAASAQTFPNLLKRKRDGEEEDYDES